VQHAQPQQDNQEADASGGQTEHEHPTAGQAKLAQRDKAQHKRNHEQCGGRSGQDDYGFVVFHEGVPFVW
jgi:hypothetical protein